MRLGIQLLDSSATLNRFKVVSVLTINQGETFDVFFQLVDQEQSIRYVPAVGATCLVEVPRLAEAFGTLSNQRVNSDFSIRRGASNPFPDDRSIWKLTLSTTETANLMSSNIRVTITEGSVVKIALMPQALKVNRSEG